MLEQAEGDIKGVVIERGTEVFCMQIQALEFMAVQEKERESRCNKRQGQRTRFMSELAREATTCGICMVGEAMQKFMAEGIDDMEGDMGLYKDPTLMEHTVPVARKEF